VVVVAEFPKVSVVMPVYNQAAHLGEALDSILGQTFEDFEIVCIDDGSTDGTSTVLATYEHRDTRLVVHRQPNSGVVAALNRGCRLARSRYIARMDADDIALPDRLERQVNFLDSHPEVAVVGGAVTFMRADGTPGYTASCPVDDAGIKATLARSSPLFHSAVVMRKAALAAVGWYRPIARHAEDYDLWLRMADRFEMANLSEPVLRYRLHSEQVASLQLRHQPLVALAVRTAARILRESGHDPLRDVADPGSIVALLHQLGVSEYAMASCVLDAHVARAYVLARIGDQRGADAVWREALTYARAARARRPLMAKVLLARARLHQEQGQRVRAMVAAARTCLASPTLVPELQARRAARRLRSRIQSLG
jgi:glycosyltransferase involved in cell wall biosynthesis